MKRSVSCLFLVVAAVGIGSGLSRADDPRHSSAPAVATYAAPVNLAAEIARAKSEHKLLLLEFASSDTCPPCIVLQRDVFSKPEFLNYEKSNLVFVRIDFPEKTELPPKVKAANMDLATQYDVFAFPTFVALDRDGKEFWRMPQKGEMTINTEIFQPKGFIALVETVRKKGE